MLLISFLILLIYTYFIIWLWQGLNRAKTISTTSKIYKKTYFSVIIAAHNEAKLISAALERLIDQNYPSDKYEIIVAADRCSDGTADIVKEYMQKSPCLQLIEINQTPENISPKKYALQQAINIAASDSLVLMDADSFAGKVFLKTMNLYFAGGAQVVINIPKFEVERNLLHSYLLPERLAAWSIASAAAGHRKPFLCFGTSWAYSKKLMEQAGGFSDIQHFLSGDDDLLLSRMADLQPKTVVCFLPDGWVRTHLPVTLKAFFIQRRRHHSAGSLYPQRVKSGYALFHGSNLLLWILPVFTTSALIPLIGKILLDVFTLRFSAAQFKEKINIVHYLIFEIGYLLHNILIAPLSFFGKIRWK